LKCALSKDAKSPVESGFSALARAVLLVASEEFRRRLGIAMKQHIETRFPHLFSVKVLDKLPGLFKPQRYLYHCARCKWSFVVNDGRRGALRPIAEDGQPLSREEVVARAETFAAGPCPAMRVVTEAHVRLHANGNGNGNGNGSNGHGPAHVENPARPEAHPNQLGH
jgi:hypothetical protein